MCVSRLRQPRRIAESGCEEIGEGAGLARVMGAGRGDEVYAAIVRHGPVREHPHQVPRPQLGADRPLRT